jgi:molybdopterin-guanine dinucleotide biosynthesis protein A
LKKYPNFSGVILAGGKNSRFGGFNKAFIEIEGEKIINHQIKILSELFDQIIVVSNQPELFVELKNIQITSDRFKSLGPLAGIDAALQIATNQNIFLVSCDMPFINKYMIVRVLDEFENSDIDILISKTPQFRQPLFGAYSKKIKEKLDNFLKTSEKLSIQEFLSNINYGFVLFENSKEIDLNFININSIEDLERLKMIR